MKDLLKSTFELNSSKSTYSVHPNLFSMLSLKHSVEIERLFGDRYLPVMRQASLGMFIDHLLTNFETLKKNDFSKEEISSILKTTVETYKAEKTNEFLSNIQAQIDKTDKDILQME